MASKVQSKCRCCGEIFTVDVRNRGRQKYCAKRGCRGMGQAARQRRWLTKPEENQDYFSGPEHVERVRVWRAAHPGYWRSHRRGRGVALQDALRLQGPVLIGLIAHLSDSALQEDIAATARGLLQLGQDILWGQKLMPHKRVLRADRLRQVPPQFSWIDQRVVRDRHSEHCDVQALALYLMLVTVADAQGSGPAPNRHRVVRCP